MTGEGAGQKEEGKNDAGAAAITRGSGSNLALAFVVLPKARRRDLEIFYAFCRVVDDVADDTAAPLEARRAGLERWHAAIDAPTLAEPALAAPVRDLIARHQLPAWHFHEIIHGCEMDLVPVRYQTWEELRLYCHRVASVVGLVSATLFGCREPGSHEYALHLGLALQLTNILRDVGEDLEKEGRIYLPLEDCARFGVSEESLRARRRDEDFLALMEFEAERARAFYAAAVAALPARDRSALAAAELMRAIYSRLLARMQRDGFRVFDRRYRLSRWEKAALVVRTLAAGWLRRRA